LNIKKRILNIIEHSLDKIKIYANIKSGNLKNQQKFPRRCRMTAKSLSVNEGTRSVHIKTYGNLQVSGGAQPEVVVNSSDPASITLVQTHNVIYLTSMTDCSLQIPPHLSVSLEKCLGSARFTALEAPIQVEKVLGNLHAENTAVLKVEKVGGNCALNGVTKSVTVEKIGGNLTAENSTGITVEKMGGSCLLKNCFGDVAIRKVGGDFACSGLKGIASIDKVGGDFKCDQSHFGLKTHVGGDITLLLSGTPAHTNLKAGGDVKLYLPPDLTDVKLSLYPSGELKIQALGLDQTQEDSTFEHTFGDPNVTLEVYAGGDITLLDTPWANGEVVGDLSSAFSSETVSVNQLIHEQVRKATELASRKIEEAQKNLDQIKIEIKGDEFKIPKIKIPDISIPGVPPIPGVPNVPGVPDMHKANVADQSADVRKKATDEERLLILQMLQEKKITVAQAESLFRALEK